MFSEKKYHFLSVDLGLFEFSLGVLMVATGHTVDVSQTEGNGFPWQVYTAPTAEGSSITYTRNGKIYVKEGGDFNKDEHSTIDGEGLYHYKGVYSSHLANSKSENILDYKKNGLRAFKLTEELVKQDIDLLTIYHDGKVSVQTCGGRRKAGEPCFVLLLGTCMLDSGDRFMTEITSDEELHKAKLLI